MLQNATKQSTRRHPPQLPHLHELPEELKPLLSRVYAHHTRTCILNKDIRDAESTLSRLREECRREERAALELEMNLWDRLGKIKKLPPDPKIRAHFTRLPPEIERRITPEAAALKALNELSAEERATLIAQIQEQLAKEKAKPSDESSDESSSDGPWTGSLCD